MKSKQIKIVLALCVLSLFGCSSFSKKEPVENRQPNQVTDVGGKSELTSYEDYYGLQCLQNQSIVNHSKIGPIALTAVGGYAKKSNLKSFIGQTFRIVSAGDLKGRKNVASLEQITVIKDFADLGGDRAVVKLDIPPYKNVWFLCDIVIRSGEL